MKKEYQAYWMVDGAHPMVREAVREGWLTPGMTVLEIGCGIGRGAAWLDSGSCH